MAKAVVYMVHDVVTKATKYSSASSWPVARLGGPNHQHEIYAVVAEVEAPSFSEGLRDLKQFHDVQVLLQNGLLDPTHFG